MEKKKIKRLAIKTNTLDHIKSMTEQVKAHGRYCKVNNELLLNWITTEFYEKYFDQNISRLYYTFLCEDLFRKGLLSSQMSLDEINKEIKDLLKKRKSFLEPKSLKIKVEKNKLQTSASSERKVEFE